MVVLAGYDCAIGYKTETVTYNTTPLADTYPAPGVDYGELVFVDKISLSFEPDWLGSTGVGRRTRRDAKVTKRDDKLTIEGYVPAYDGATDNIYNLLVYVDNVLYGAGDDDHLSLLIVVDADRDGDTTGATSNDAGNRFIYACGVYLNSVTLSGKEGEATRFSIEFSINRLYYSATSLDSDLSHHKITASTTDALFPYESSDLVLGGALDPTYDDYVPSWSVTVNANRKKSWGHASKYPNCDTPGNLEITGSITADFWGFNNIVDLEADQGGLSTDTLTITYTTGKTMTMTGVNFDSIGLDINEGELLQQNIPFTASTITFN